MSWVMTDDGWKEEPGAPISMGMISPKRNGEVMHEDAYLEEQYEDRFRLPDEHYDQLENEPRDCEYCNEQEGDGDDILAEFVVPGEFTDYGMPVTKLVHGQCGIDAGWEQA